MSETLNALFKLRADFQDLEGGASKAQAKLDELAEGGSGAAGKLAKGFEAVSGVLSAMSGYIGAATTALGLYERGMSIATERLRAHQQEQVLSARFGEAWVKSFTETYGTIADDEELVQKALRLTRGELAISRDEMDLLAKAAANLANKEGREFIPTLDALAMGLRGSTKGLREFGIEVKTTGGEQEKLNDLWRQLKGIAAEDVIVDPAMQAIRDQQKALRDALDEWKDALTVFFTWLTATISEIGETLTNLNPFNVFNRGVNQLAEGLGIGANFGAPDTSAMDAQMEAEAKLDRQHRAGAWLADRARARWRELGEQARAQRDAELAMPESDEGGPSGWLRDPITKQPVKPRGGGRGGGYEQRFAESSDLVRTDSALPYGGIYADDLGRGMFDVRGNRARPHAAGAWASLREETGQSRDSQLAGMLDKRSEWQRDIGDRTTRLGEAFGMGTSALAESMNAAMTGSDSMGKAFVRAIRMQLKSLAIKESVMAIGDAAGLNFAGAGQHVAAAAAATAGYYLLGELAGGDSGGGIPSVGGGGAHSQAGGGWAGSGPRGDTSQSPVVVNIYGPVGDGKATGEYVARAMRSARRGGAGHETAGKWD